MMRLVALVKKVWPDFEMAKLEQFLAREGVVVPEGPPNVPIAPLMLVPYPAVPEGVNYQTPNGPQQASAMQAHAAVQPPYMFGPSPYPYPMIPHAAVGNRAGAVALPPPNSFRREPEPVFESKGVDPQGRDMSSATAIAKGFGVSALLTEDPRYADSRKSHV